MPLRFGPRDLHLRTQRDGLKFAKEGQRKEAWGKKEPNGVAKTVQAVRDRVGAVMETASRAVAAVRDTCAAGAKAVYERVTDPLTVGGSAVVVFSLTMMMREPLLQALQEHQHAVAVAQAERDEKHRALHALLEHCDNNIIMTDGEGFLALDTTAYDAPERVVFVLNDIPEEALPHFFAHLRQQGLTVPYALLTNPERHHGMHVSALKEGEDDQPPSTIFQSIHDFRAVWNQTHWEHEQLKYPGSSAEMQQHIYEALHRFSPAETEAEGMKGSVFVIARDKRKDSDYREYDSYLQRLHNGCEKNPWCAIVHVDHHLLHHPAPQPVPETDKRFIASHD